MTEPRSVFDLIEELGIKVMPEEEIIASNTPDKPTWFVCMPTKLGPPAVPASVAQCKLCGQDVWYSKLSGQPMIDGGLPVACLECMLKAAENAEP